MTTQQLDILKKDLAFAAYVIRMLKTSEMKQIDGSMWVKIFDNPTVPDSYRKDLQFVDANHLEDFIPEVAVLCEIKILEYQKELAEKRLAEIRGIPDGKPVA